MVFTGGLAAVAPLLHVCLEIMTDFPLGHGTVQLCDTQVFPSFTCSGAVGAGRECHMCGVEHYSSGRAACEQKLLTLRRGFSLSLLFRSVCLLLCVWQLPMHAPSSSIKFSLLLPFGIGCLLGRKTPTV